MRLIHRSRSPPSSSDESGLGTKQGPIEEETIGPDNEKSDSSAPAEEPALNLEAKGSRANHEANCTVREDAHTENDVSEFSGLSNTGSR
jgi:hypothetical protein